MGMDISKMTRAKALKTKEEHRYAKTTDTNREARTRQDAKYSENYEHSNIELRKCNPDKATEAFNENMKESVFVLG